MIYLLCLFALACLNLGVFIIGDSGIIAFTALLSFLTTMAVIGLWRRSKGYQ